MKALLPLILAVALFLVGCVVYDNPQQDITFTDIITQGERANGPTVEFTQEFIDGLKASQDYFTILTFNAGNNYRVNLPRIYRRTINLTRGQVSHQLIPLEIIRVSDNLHVSNNWHGFLFPNNIHNFTIDEIMTITAEGMSTRIRVTRSPVPVQTLDIAASSGTDIRVGQSRWFSSIWYPTNASFTALSFAVHNVVTDHGIVSGLGTSEYAFFEGQNLRTTQSLSVGDTITVRATSTVDQVQSNFVTLTVVRTPITQVHFVLESQSTSVTLGQVVPFNIFIHEENATFNVEGGLVDVVMDSSFGNIVRLEGNRFELTVTTSIAQLNQQIQIQVIANDDGQLFQRTFHLNIRQIFLQSITVQNRDAGKELQRPEPIKVRRGDIIPLAAVPYPLDANLTVPIRILASISNQFIVIDPENNLVIRDNAPTDLEFTINGVFSHIASPVYRFIVVKIPVKGVTSTASHGDGVWDGETDTLTIGGFGGMMVVFDSVIYPANATYPRTSITVLEGAEWVTSNYMDNAIFFSHQVPRGGQIRVRVYADGVGSNIITIKFPLLGILIGSIYSDEFETSWGGIPVLGQEIRIDHQFNPSPHVVNPESLEFFITQGYGLATISGRYLTIHTSGQVKVQARHLGVYSNVITFTLAP